MTRAHCAALALTLTACSVASSPSTLGPVPIDASVTGSSLSDGGALTTASERPGPDASEQTATAAGTATPTSDTVLSSGWPSTLDAGVPHDTAAADPTSDAAYTSPPVSDASTAAHPCGAPASPSWRRCDANPLWQAGFEHPGVGIELSVGDPDVMYDAEAGLYKAWWSTGIAPSYVSENIAMGIKYAESRDGVRWTVQEELAISGHRNASDWDYSKLETPSVVKVPEFPPERRYVLFYAGGNDVAVPALEYTWYQIGVAFSADGKHFERLPAEQSPYADRSTPFDDVEGLVIYGTDVFPASLQGVADGLVADPEVIYEGGVFHLFFSSLAVNTDRAPLAFGVSHATSIDAIHWTFAAENPVPNLNGAGPTVVESAQGYELWFYADSDADKAQIPSVFNPMYGIFRSTSLDLNGWTATDTARDLVWDGNFATERYGIIAAGDMLFHDGEYRYYYPAFGDFDVPTDFVVPTHDDYLPAVIMLDVAYRR